MAQLIPTQVSLTFELTPVITPAFTALLDALNNKGAETPKTHTHSVSAASDFVQTKIDDLPKSTLTIDPPTETASIEEPEKVEPVKAPGAQDKKKEDPPAVSKTEVRAKALELSKAGKQATLKKLFKKYGGEKLSDIAADNYAALMADLEAAANG